MHISSAHYEHKSPFRVHYAKSNRRTAEETELGYPSTAVETRCPYNITDLLTQSYCAVIL